MRQKKVTSEVSRYLASLGRKGGNSRARVLTPEQRSAVASNAATVRWNRREREAQQVDQYLVERWQQIKRGRHAFVGSTRVKLQPSLKIEDGQCYGFKAGDELLDIDDVAARLAIPKGTVYELCRHRSRIRANPMPHFKVGRRLKFNWTAICAWLDTLEKAGQR